jgi:uncharacterized protein (TIGR03435 family)
MLDMSEEERSRLWSAVRHVLMAQWDPIGVSDTPEAADEYDGYIGAVCDLLARKASHNEIAAYLREIETQRMGLTDERGAPLVPAKVRDAAVSSLKRLTAPSPPQNDAVHRRGFRNWKLFPVCILAAASALAQTTPSPAPLAFDVASVRPSKPGSPQHTNVPLDAGNVYAAISPDDARTVAGGLLIATHQPLGRYITFAYKLSGTQELALRFNYFSGLPKSGAPAWVTGGFDSPADAFDIEARASSNPTIDQMRLMMQALLADRFHLVVRYQTSEASIFALVHSGVLGPNLRPHPAKTTPAPQLLNRTSLPPLPNLSSPHRSSATCRPFVASLPTSLHPKTRAQATAPAASRSPSLPRPCPL